MKVILIITDFSDHSKHTIEYVVNFVLEVQLPCKIILLNTYLVQETDPITAITVNDELKGRSKKFLDMEKVEALKKVSNQNISIETISFMGSLANVLLHLLKKEKIDLVAIGNDEKNVDSISGILRKQKCPLLITYLSPGQNEGSSF